MSKSQKEAANVSTLTKLAQMAEQEGATEVVSDRDKIRLENHGDMVIGRLVEVREFEPKNPGEKPLRVASIDLPDGRPVRLNCPTDLARKLTGDLVGKFVAIANEGVMDTGHRTGTPMTVFKVYNFGTTLPARIAAMAEGLPF